MPKEKFVRMSYYDYSGLKISCQFCGYFTQSETGMKLHRKVKHGITKNFNFNPPIFMCDGCNNRKTECKCTKH